MKYFLTLSLALFIFLSCEEKKPDQPPKIETGSLVEAGVSDAKLIGRVNPNGLETKVNFEYGLSRGLGEVASATQSPVVGEASVEVSTQLSNLQSGSTYYYRIKAENDKGVVFSDIEEFQTVAVFFAENGITVMCPSASPGDIVNLDGVSYEVVDRALLEQRRDEGADLTKVCTSLVTDMSELFRGWNFNQSINNWDVSKVINMRLMFAESNFNQSIDAWDVENVTDMSSMFWVAESFNQNISTWDVSNVINMAGMFYYATSFNQSVNEWDVSNVIRMLFMFARSGFNQPLDKWNVGKVENMSRMFLGSPFNQPLASWDVKNVMNFNGMFAEASVFNQPIGNWNMSKATDIGLMFYYAEKFNQPLGEWDVADVTDMELTFFHSYSFNQDISGWCVRRFFNEPNNFSVEAPLSDANKPVWGTCPGG